MSGWDQEGGLGTGGVWSRKVRGRSLLGRIYPFKAPRGPSEIVYFSVKHKGLLIARSFLTGEQFLVAPIMLEDLREITCEMEVLAWAAT